MTLARRTQALLDLIADDRAARCGEIASDACARAHATLRDAHAKARADVRDAFVEERRRAEDVLAGARARLASQRRHAEQRRAAALLAEGLARLPAVLARRWEDAAARARWTDAIAERCLAVLPIGAWRIAHPAGWPDAEARALAARIAEATGAAPLLAPDVGIDAGLRISAGGIVVDGTVAGLAGDTTLAGARLLGLLELARRPEPARE